MKTEQLSFLRPIRPSEKPKIYDATICDKCLCHVCKYSVEIFPSLDEEECKTVWDRSCFNCDECYYYGMDDEILSKGIVKFECDKFKMSNYHIELRAKLRRNNFRVI